MRIGGHPGRVTSPAGFIFDDGVPLYLAPGDPSPNVEKIMPDPTETIRRQRLAEINSDPQDRPALETRYGKVWDTAELARDFVVVGYLAPFIVVRRKSDGVRGSLEFQHLPRFYFNFRSD